MIINQQCWNLSGLFHMAILDWLGAPCSHRRLCPGTHSDRSTTAHRWLVIGAEGNEHLTKLILDLLSEACPLGLSKGHRDVFFSCLLFFFRLLKQIIWPGLNSKGQKNAFLPLAQKERQKKQRERERENTCELLYHRIQLILLGMSEYYEHKD